MKEVKFNPKKHKEHRRKSQIRWTPAKSTGRVMPEAPKLCKNCVLRPRSNGSSLCEQCKAGK